MQINSIQFKPATQLTFDTVELDLQRLRDYMNHNDSQSILLDLSQVTRCDVAGIAWLIEVKRLCKQQHKSFEILAMSDSIKTMAELCGVSKLVQTIETLV